MMANVLRWYSHGVSVVSVSTAVIWTAWTRYQCTPDSWDCLIPPEYVFLIFLATAAVIAILLCTIDTFLAAHYQTDSRTSAGDGR